VWDTDAWADEGDISAHEAAVRLLSRRSSEMPRVIISHEVADVQRWLAGKAERAAAIGAIGANVIDTVALDGSNKIAVTADVNDLTSLQAMLASPPAEVAALMEKHGVIPPITVYVEK
jgi:hypothetical protein